MDPFECSQTALFFPMGFWFHLDLKQKQTKLTQLVYKPKMFAGNINMYLIIWHTLWQPSRKWLCPGACSAWKTWRSLYVLLYIPEGRWEDDRDNTCKAQLSFLIKGAIKIQMIISITIVMWFKTTIWKADYRSLSASCIILVWFGVGCPCTLRSHMKAFFRWKLS